MVIATSPVIGNRNRSDDQPPAAQKGVGGISLGSVGEARQNEIADAVRHGDAQPAQFVGRPLTPAEGMLPDLLDEGGVPQGGHPGQQGRGGDVERTTQAIDNVDDRRRGVTPAQPQSAQCVDLRKCAGHHDVFRLVDQFDAGAVIRRRHVFGVSGIDDQQDLLRQAGMQPANLADRQIGAGRIVGVGDEHSFRPGRHRGEQRVDVRRQVPFRRRHRLCAETGGGNGVHEEAMAAVQQLVARPDIGPAEDRQQFVRAGSTGDARRIEAEMRSQGFTQLRRRAVGIAAQTVGGATGCLNRLRAWTQGSLVGGQFDDPGDAGERRFAAHIG